MRQVPPIRGPADDERDPGGSSAARRRARGVAPVDRVRPGLPTVGVEEEYFLVGAADRAVRDGASRVLRRIGASAGELVSGELTEYQVEGKTPPCARFDELVEHLGRVRSAISAAAAAEGCRITASGTPVLGARQPAPLRADQHNDDLTRTMRALHDDYTLSGLHVHVQVPDLEHAVLVGNHLRPWLPALIALSANSPFWAERDSGYASWRAITADRGPVTGPPPYFASADDREWVVERLRDSGAAPEEAALYWDVRPCHHLPTVEVRVMDVNPCVRRTAAFAQLVRALVVTALRRVRVGDQGRRCATSCCARPAGARPATVGRDAPGTR